MADPVSTTRPILLALGASFLLTVLIIAGSRNLEHYDSAQSANAIGFAPLLIIPRYFIYFAFAGWLAAAAGLVHSLLLRSR